MIELTQRGGVAVMTMRHGKANALDIALCRDIVRHFAEASASAVVLTGQGHIFSAGVDLIQAAEGGAEYLREFLPVLSQAFAAVFFHPAPVVAAINGHAIAGGCVLAGAADRRMMAQAGRIGVTELLVGVPFPPIALEIMRHAVAPERFEDTILSGATFAPDDAVARGLVDEVVDPEALIKRAVLAAQTLAALSPPAFALSKRQLRAPAVERVAQARNIDEEVTKLWCAEETLARVRDYVSRTFKKI